MSLCLSREDHDCVSTSVGGGARLCSVKLTLSLFEVRVVSGT